LLPIAAQPRKLSDYVALAKEIPQILGFSFPGAGFGFIAVP
jgi:hypothetical protein